MPGLHPEVFVAFRAEGGYSRVGVKNTVLIVGVEVVLSDVGCVKELQGGGSVSVTDTYDKRGKKGSGGGGGGGGR